MMTLGIAADGTVEVPPLAQTGLAGWYEPGPSPGEEGSAVVIGHVDNRSAPAVFFGLRRLRGGEAIEVERADGSIALFLVDSLRQVSKGSFPTDEVYSESGPAVLRLITCGGSFDRAQGSYRDNLIVTAHFAGLRNSEK
jgi:sortase (surface protein transpeptidase)